MEASATPTPAPPFFQPDTQKIKQYLLQRGVYPTPKIIRNLTKKQIQKNNRKLKKQQSQLPSSSLTPIQKQALAEANHFNTLRREYKRFNRAMTAEAVVGRPWERTSKISQEKLQFDGECLKKENLNELKEIFEEDLRWVLDDDIDMPHDDGTDCYSATKSWDPDIRQRQHRSEAERIGFFIDKLSKMNVTARDWKLVRMMKQSDLKFSEGQLLRILEGLEKKDKWKEAMAIVERVYENRREYRSRFVYTKLLAVLGKAKKPHEAVRIFNLMREDCNIYPDMAAYHSIAVTLGQAGLLKELVNIIECMKLRPKRIGNIRLRNFDPVLEPDLVVYNAVLNACVSSCQWKGVSWVFQMLRKDNLKPDGATFGLAMEVMLRSKRYDLVHEYFRKMVKNGQAPKSITYKVLVRALWEEGKINEAVEAVREMEERGVVGTASVYYELGCCLCHSGMWIDAMKEVENIQKLPHSKPLVVTYTGMIQSSMDGGYADHGIYIFENMKKYCDPNIGTINVMLKLYQLNGMFSQAKELFEEIKCCSVGADPLVPDEYTYKSMLESSANAFQWEYFEYVYKEMTMSELKLDQSKNTRLLVKASRAGKRHLLEHAFYEILEAGEIPNELLYAEMIIQAVVEHDFEKAVCLIGSMAYAPFQLSESRWTEILEGIRDKVDQEGLRKLLDSLVDCRAQSEATVVNLSRSLQKVCASRTPGDSSGNINNDIDDYDDDKVFISKTSSDGESSTNTYFTDDDNNKMMDTQTNSRNFEDSDSSNSPSANEILEAWKASRNQDMIFFPS